MNNIQADILKAKAHIAQAEKHMSEAAACIKLAGKIERDSGVTLVAPPLEKANESFGDIFDTFAISRIQLPQDVHDRIIGIVVEHIRSVAKSYEQAAANVKL